ncbi:MAG TPA: endonuclease/exonuclease/phosphatase family protein [Gemmatimonadales bacterium]|nr:endonuclease/exonuclease/phosphatase family protein [Gemmatimonadales bacterium]
MTGIRPRAGAALAALAGLLVAACATMTNLTDAAGPRFEGAYAAPVHAAGHPPVRIVSFNIRHAREIDRAIAVLAGDSLRGADIVALQEMDDAGVERIARALSLNYAYYPASIHPASGRYFGPAVLSRWPIQRSWKLLLPHAGWARGQRRTATAAVVRVQDTPLLVYAVHLETPVQISDAERRDQVMAVVADAARHPGPVVVAGDFNGSTVGPMLRREGYVWETARVGPTISFFSWDHIFTRGLPRPAAISAGVVRDVRGASDHHPIWAVVSAPERPVSSPTPAEPSRRRRAGG